MGRQLIATLPRHTKDNEQGIPPWCPTGSLTIRLKPEGEPWVFNDVKTFSALGDDLKNEATATGWYWPHFYYDVLHNSFAEERDKVGTSIDSVIPYSAKMLSKLTGAAAIPVILNLDGGDKEVILQNQKGMLDAIDDRVSLVATVF